MRNFHTISRNGKESNSDREVNGKYPQSKLNENKASSPALCGLPKTSPGPGAALNLWEGKQGTVRGVLTRARLWDNGHKNVTPARPPGSLDAPVPAPPRRQKFHS